MSESSRLQKPSRLWPIAFTVCFLALLGCIAFFYATKRASDLVGSAIKYPEKLLEASTHLLGTKTTISSESILLPPQDSFELTLIRRKIVAFTKQTNSRLGSKSTRIVRGEFELKAGYDLSEGIRWEFSEKEHSLKVMLPPPQINSIETLSQGTYYLDEGFIKAPSSEESDEGNRENREAARREAMEQGITDEVQRAMERRIKDIFYPFFGDNIAIVSSPQNTDTLSSEK